ncbi:MAG: serine/threonine-protein kinase [Gemmatimonadales bacterium]
MPSALILERLRRALAPDHVVELELASGGMGAVFLGHDVALDRPVAIKLLRPELATAEATEHFLREARILANLHHPNVVQVYRVGEADGLFFYVMEYVGGETLESRLRRGSLSSGAALKLARDLLDGLEAAHQAGVIHRDVKPANLLLVGHRALLADFGIALGREEGQVATGAVWGTPGYMSPEQGVGDPVGVRSDIYAAGAVIYEAYTGRRWVGGPAVEWKGVPRSVVPILVRALASASGERWPDAATFRRALWRTRTRRYVRRTFLLLGGGLVVGAMFTGLASRLLSWDEPAPGSLRIAIERFNAVGEGPAVALGDSLTALIRAELAGHPDFMVTTVAPRRGEKGSVLTVSGRFTLEAGSVRGRVMGAYHGKRPMPLGDEVLLPRESWTSLADSLASRVLLAVWKEKSPIASSLPVRTLPRSDAGLAEFLVAERLVGQARWGEAYQAYTRLEAIDSTCLLCSWRIGEVERWLGMTRDPARTRRSLLHVDSFPPVYRSLIRAASVPLPARLDTLGHAAAQDRSFFLPWVHLGDELFHRGPLVGHTRHEALEPLEHAGRLRPDYAPIWEHLAWVRTAEGDSAGAAEALQAMEVLGEARDPYSRELRALLRVGFAWRFSDPALAEQGIQQELADPEVMKSHDLGAGPRLLSSFDAPEGAVAMGMMFTTMPRNDLVRSGSIAAVLGSVTLGRLQQATVIGRTFHERVPDLEVGLFVAELEGAIALLDSASAPTAPAAAALHRLVARGAASDVARQRAAWMLTLLERHAGITTDPNTDEILRQEGGLRPFATLVSADSLASRGEHVRALELTESAALDSAGRQLDPFYRAVTRLLRASWYEATGNDAGARRELRWHEHTDLVGYPVGAPQAGEVDWAFGTLARWRRAQVLDRLGERGVEVCAAYRAVDRMWRGGDRVFVARADTAALRADALHCEPAR